MLTDDELSLVLLEEALYRINEINENTCTEKIMALAELIEMGIEKYQDVDMPLYEESKLLMTMENDTREEIMSLVCKIRIGIMNLHEQIFNE